jgi:cysteine desulfuration protein SufE
MAEPSSVDLIRSDFELLDEWEDRYRYLIELGRQLAPLADADRTEANKVRGCASQVWLRTDVAQTGDGRVLRFTGDSDAHIVKGLIAILLALYDAKTPDAILAADAHRLFDELGLAGHLTPQRSNGFASMVARIRADASAEQARASQ